MGETSWFPAIIPGFLLVFGIVGILYNLWSIIDYNSRMATSQTWPVTTGIVLNKVISGGPDPDGWSPYYPEITFVYTMSGVDFKKKLSLGAKWKKSTAIDALNIIKPTIEVRYNPERPAQHVTGVENAEGHVSSLRWYLLWTIFTIPIAGGFLCNIALTGSPQ